MLSEYTLHQEVYYFGYALPTLLTIIFVSTTIIALVVLLYSMKKDNGKSGLAAAFILVAILIISNFGQIRFYATNKQNQKIAIDEKTYELIETVQAYEQQNKLDNPVQEELKSLFDKAQ